jgi:hypothetical protein
MSSSATQTSDNDPMQVRHGRALWRDVVATKTAADSILDILTPDGEESPVLDSLSRLEAKVDILLAVLLPPSGGADGR